MTSDKRFYLLASVFIGGVLLLAFGFSHARFIESFVDSDKLLPADWTRHIFHDGYPALGFQLPRTPSVFPDLLIFSPIQVITGSWRLATFGLAAAFLAALIGAAGTIAGRIAGVPASLGITACWIVVSQLLLAELAYSGWGRHFIVVQPVSHGGVFVVSLWTAILADDLRRAYKGAGLLLLLFVVCGLAVLSDKLFVFTFVIPLSSALFFVPVDNPTRRLLIFVVAMASLAGWFGADLINRQPDILLDWSMIAKRIEIFLGDINASIFLGTFAPVILLIGAPIVARQLPAAMFSIDTARFYWAFAIVAMLGTTALTAAFLYEDRSHYRYLASIIWWPTIFAGAALAMALKHRPHLTLALSSVISAIMAAMLLYAGIAPVQSLWHWQHPVTQCLLGQTDPARFRDGLAEYWQARAIEVSSDWQLQVDPLHRNGEIAGSDLASYTSSHFDRSRPPDYHFIVMTSLDPGAINARFGMPDSVIACGDNPIWVYRKRLTPVALR